MTKIKPGLRNVYILLLICIVMMASGCSSKNEVQPVMGEQTAKEPVQHEKKDVIEAAGKIKAKDIRNIILDFPAIIEDVIVDEGDRVKLGDKLITLNLDDYKKQIEDKESNLTQGKLQLESSKSSLSVAEAELQRQKSQYNDQLNNDVSVQLKEDDYEYQEELVKRAKEDLEDKEVLYQSSAISENDLVDARRRVEDLERTLKDKKLSLDDGNLSRKQTLDKLKIGITQQESQINQLKLSIEVQNEKLNVLQSDIKQMKDKLNKTYLKDNIIQCDIKNGLIQEIQRVAGDSIQANNKLFSLVDMDRLVVEADVSEDFIKDVKVGAEVEIFPLADSGKKYTGHVLKIGDMGIEKNGETIISTEISIDDMDEFIKPNYNVDVKISE